MDIEIQIERSLRRNSTDIFIIKNNADGSRSMCTDLSKSKFEVMPEYQSWEGEPTIRIPRQIEAHFMKAMANELYERKIKADGAPVLENELTAVKNHLEDMRTLVFKKPTLEEVLK